MAKRNVESTPKGALDEWRRRKEDSKQTGGLEDAAIQLFLALVWAEERKDFPMDQNCPLIGMTSDERKELAALVQKYTDKLRAI